MKTWKVIREYERSKVLDEEIKKRMGVNQKLMGLKDEEIRITPTNTKWKIEVLLENGK